MPETLLPYLLLEPLELTTLLVRRYGIHRGLWTLHASFHYSGHNFVPHGKETADELTVDAAAVNPPR